MAVAADLVIQLYRLPSSANGNLPVNGDDIVHQPQPTTATFEMDVDVDPISTGWFDIGDLSFYRISSMQTTGLATPPADRSEDGLVGFATASATRSRRPSSRMPSTGWAWPTVDVSDDATSTSTSTTSSSCSAAVVPTLKTDIVDHCISLRDIATDPYVYGVGDDHLYAAEDAYGDLTAVDSLVDCKPPVHRFVAYAAGAISADEAASVPYVADLHDEDDAEDPYGSSSLSPSFSNGESTDDSTDDDDDDDDDEADDDDNDEADAELDAVTASTPSTVTSVPPAARSRAKANRKASKAGLRRSAARRSNAAKASAGKARATGPRRRILTKEELEARQERARIRSEKNRAAAKKCRERKQDHFKDLLVEVQRLRQDNLRMRTQAANLIAEIASVKAL